MKPMVPQNGDVWAQGRVVTKILDEARTRHYGQIETAIKLFIQPKPRYLPTWLWHRLLTRVLVIQYESPTGIVTED